MVDRKPVLEILQRMRERLLIGPFGYLAPVRSMRFIQN